MIFNRHRYGKAAQIPEREQSPRRDDATRSGKSDDARHETCVKSDKRMSIREVRGRLEVVEEKNR